MAVETTTYSGAPAGMNVALPPHELADEEARYLQDFLVDIPGKTRMRGPVQAASGLSELGDRIYGVAQCVNPTGDVRLAVLAGPASTGTDQLRMFSSDKSFTTAKNWPVNLFSSTVYPIADLKPMLGGGTLLGAATGYELSDTQTLAIWRGADKADYATGTITVARGSTSVTGSGTSWSANLAPGMFLLGTSNILVGVVKSVESDTELTLEQPALRAETAASYTLTSVRGFGTRVATGRITCATSSTAVQGSFTKFKTHGLDSGIWKIYTNPGLEFVGNVDTVTDDTDLTLDTNAAIALDNARYVAIKDEDVSGASNAGKVGFLSVQYSGRQFYANLNEQSDEQVGALSSRVNFSDSLDPEAVDLDPTDGDWFDIGSAKDYESPIYAMAATYNALLFIKENEVFALYGSTPSQWSVRKLHDDGTLCGMSVATIDGGAIWAGRRGIYFYDGVEVRNLTEDKLGNWFERGITETFDPTTDRMYGMIDRDHYFLFIESFSGQNAGVGVTKGATTTYPTRLTISVNLRTGAVTTFTNVNIRGSVELPAEEGKGVLYAVNVDDTNNGRVCLARDLFDDTGMDSLECEGDSAGPDPYIETKKYDLGDAQRKKLVKQLQLHYKLVGDVMALDTVVGLNDTGVTSSSSFAASSTWVNKRIKFLKRSTHIAFRLSCGNESTATELELGPWAIGFKYQRKGRV